MTEADELALLAARRYYAEGRKMAAIANELCVSRSSISRLLSRARDAGLVEIRIVPPRARVESLEQRVCERFNVHARVVAVPDGSSSHERYELVARAAADFLTNLMSADVILALSWGTMVNSISFHLAAKPCTNSTIVQTNGIGHTSAGVHYSFPMLERFASAFGSHVLHLPFPIFFDSAESKEIVEKERLLRHIRALIANADIFLFNLGTVQSGVPSQPYLSGYFLDDAEFGELRSDGAVGDVSTTFIDETGEADRVRMNSRTTGPDLDTIRGIDRRVCVTSGNHKVRALEAALHGGLVTDLVIDETTALALLG